MIPLFACYPGEASLGSLNPSRHHYEGKKADKWFLGRVRASVPVDNNGTSKQPGKTKL